MALQRNSTEMTTNAFKDTLAKAYASVEINDSDGSPTVHNSFNIASVTNEDTGEWRFTFSDGLGLELNNYVPILTWRQSPTAIRVGYVTATTATYVNVKVISATGVTDDIDGLYLVVFANN